MSLCIWFLMYLMSIAHVKGVGCGTVLSTNPVMKNKKKIVNLVVGQAATTMSHLSERGPHESCSSMWELTTDVRTSRRAIKIREGLNFEICEWNC